MAKKQGKILQFQRHVPKEKQDGLPQFEKYVEKNGISHCSFKIAVTKEK